jgi:hypothetical protein
MGKYWGLDVKVPGGVLMMKDVVVSDVDLTPGVLIWWLDDDVDEKWQVQF